MALINCPECNKTVSEIAKTCPHCGAPINTPSSEENKTTIQFTSKKLKAQGCISYFIIAFGFLVVMLGSKANEAGNDSVSTFGIYIIVAGIAWLIFTKVRVWWHHD